MSTKLLTRDKFREGVFARDNHKCVICKNDAVDAHHIIERRLWTDGGYYLDNGASLCSDCHIKAEQTLISVEAIREAARITKAILPEYFYADHLYDKWGNGILANGMRTRGELFFDESVQKVLAPVLNLFTNRVKYGRTYHLPWSEGMNSDDRMIPDANQFVGKRVVVTKKLDGENTTMYSDYIHARSIDGRHHVSRDWVKNFHANIAHDIPPDWRVCGENMYATHSISYDNLDSFFYGFSIWNEKNLCLNWDDTLEWFDLLGITPVPLLYRGLWDEKLIKKLWNKEEWATEEGYVVRFEDGFFYKDFKNSVAKFVRKNHVQTVKHWMVGKEVVPNKLMTVDR
jgi:hypothetical protein